MYILNEQQKLLDLKKKRKQKDDYKIKLDLFQKRSQSLHEEIIKLKDEWKSKSTINKKYLFQNVEKEFKKREKELEEEQNEKIKKELNKKKSLFEPLNIDEMNEFSRKYSEEKRNREYERERKIMDYKEELNQKNELLPKPETMAYLNIIEEEKNKKAKKKNEQFEKIYMQKKILEFSKNIQSELCPVVDQKKRKEIKERIRKMKARPEKHHKKRNRILLRRRDKSKPSKYKWKLKLETNKARPRSKSSNNLKQYKSPIISRNKKSILFIDEDLLNEEAKKELLKQQMRSKSATKRKPLVRPPDYLTEMRKKKKSTNEDTPIMEGKKWKKIMSNKYNSIFDNVDLIKIKTQMLEEQTKMKEKFIQLNGGIEKNPKLGDNVSDMLIDTIKAKLTILESVSKKGK